MAKKAAAKKTRVSKLATVSMELDMLKEKVSSYFNSLRYRSQDPFQITLQAKTQDGKDGLFNVPTLIASVLTAQGLGKEVTLSAEANAKGGTLFVRFYTPVPKNGLDG